MKEYQSKSFYHDEEEFQDWITRRAREGWVLHSTTALNTYYVLVVMERDVPTPQDAPLTTPQDKKATK